ncbi:Ppx/GppA phosphatase family protein [Hyphobacterium marinum]|uniref:Ppx/GppA phosphatase family protein n=1 Tax=Hyphobacterium marinum TaxID=3116574 RepID=UPI004039B891
MAREPVRAEEPPSRKSGGRRPRRDRRPPGPAYAAIDLGTNNCRMLIARRSPDGFRIIDSFSRIVRLGEGLNESGALSSAAMDRVIAALSVCADKMDRRSVKASRCVATQACRIASNGPELMTRIKAETGLDFDIITAEEEARLSVLGCLDLMDESFETALVVDIGGGSTELSWVDLAVWRERGGYASGGRPPVRTWASAPVGVVTLAERFPETAETADWYAAMRDFAAAQLKTPKGAKKLRKHFRDGRAHLVGTSGTITSVAGVHLELPRYERAKVDGLWMSADETLAACNRLSAQDFKGRSAEPVIGTERADLVLAGCAILEAVMAAWPAERLRVGDRGLREGLLMNLMRKPRRRRGGRRARSTAQRKAAE